MSIALVLGARPPFDGPVVHLSKEVPWNLILVCDPPKAKPEVEFLRFVEGEVEPETRALPEADEDLEGGLVSISVKDGNGARNVSVTAEINHGDS